MRARMYTCLRVGTRACVSVEVRVGSCPPPRCQQHPWRRVPRSQCERPDWCSREVRGKQEARDDARDWLPAGNRERSRDSSAARGERAARGCGAFCLVSAARSRAIEV